MRHGSSLRPDACPIKRTPPPGPPIAYWNATKNLDFCLTCFNNFSESLKKALELSPLHHWEARGFLPEHVTCDGCSASFAQVLQETRATVALALRGKMQVADIATACARFPFEGGMQALHAALMAGGFSAEEAHVLSGLQQDEPDHRRRK